MTGKTAKKKTAAPTDTSALIAGIAGYLRDMGATVSFAESCTGGLLSSLFTEVAGISDVFEGSVVAYSNRIKERELAVPAPLLRSMGAVSLPVARQMASGVRQRIGSTWALSITGIAGPGGGSPQKPVGTVCFGLCGPGVEKTEQQLFAGNRRQIQMASAEHALRLLSDELGAGKE